ncbi:PREDICTED: uncharacterized protein LOC109125373 [Camelina sativa]|uniref:Uncharacterized protein LOC109125373 n=1 Tax=Camelina sativa TaxID=90675 RepID=A0ABM1Q6V9_CAMSA|nr:PREDICTED: uncharacterized protein LOC109125373 [Camelina sativa]
MSSPHNIYRVREWMYNRLDAITGDIRHEYKEGLSEFMQFASNQEMTITKGIMSCPCVRCDNDHFLNKDVVWNHFYFGGFTPGYYVWFSHGEDFRSGPSSNQCREGDRRRQNVGSFVDEGTFHREKDNVVRMVGDEFRETLESTRVDEEPNLEARQFFEMLDAAKNLIYPGCKEGHSPLSAATQDNLAPPSYNAVQKLVSGLGLPYQMIDVCKENCMLFWRETEHLSQCRFCGADRFMMTSGRTKIPYQRMWYLPLADRLKRLYQSERTAAAMRWHAEHEFTGEISHPSDAEAWKHFHSLYPEFANEARNVYLGLCTDGFNPFGKSGRKYSLWPVIVTPYNLPPALCMKREFLFLTILVPGPNHPCRSLDVFLQPLIVELQMLWSEGVGAYDVSTKTNFNMHDALMWTISDFPTYRMLSGWTTHGRLSCPYCQDNTDAFQLKNGRKSCWFDCHRRFLRRNHPYRRSKTLFRKNMIVREGPPREYDGDYILHQLRDFGVDQTSDCGGNGHSRIDGYGEHHNWHKKSIFWRLPYWKNLLLRHNIDVMHIEKNFFENIMNTALNVAGKTKDNVNTNEFAGHMCS